MLVAGIIIGIVWVVTGFYSFMYWVNVLHDEDSHWLDDEAVSDAFLKSLLGPINYVIGYIAYRLEK
jgi:uncharacterized membrane protein